MRDGKGHDRQKWPRSTPKTWPNLRNLWLGLPNALNYKIENSPRFVAGIVDEGLNLQSHPLVHDRKLIFCNII